MYLEYGVTVLPHIFRECRRELKVARHYAPKNQGVC